MKRRRILISADTRVHRDLHDDLTLFLRLIPRRLQLSDSSRVQEETPGVYMYVRACVRATTLTQPGMQARRLRDQRKG